MSTCFFSGVGLLFVAKSNIRIATGLVKGKMCQKEFYRTAILICVPQRYDKSRTPPASPLALRRGTRATVSSKRGGGNSEAKSGKAVVVGGMNHYWSASGAIVVEAQSTIGQRTKQYSFVRRAIEEHRTAQVQKSPARRSKAPAGGDSDVVLQCMRVLTSSGL